MGRITSKDPEAFEDYDGFVDKFKPKLTTDDCYTPPEVYDAVAEYVSRRFGIRREDMVRPFYPGGDFERFDYPAGCCVVDNPPFSILQRIKRFYLDRGIPFFIFAPSLTAFSGILTEKMAHIICDANIIYENGAVVKTSFVTNLDDSIVAESCPELSRIVNEASEAAALRRKQGADAAALPKYIFPDNIVTAAMLQKYAGRGIRFEVRRGECVRVNSLDSMRAAGKSGIFGGGLLLGSDAAAERAAAERAAAERAAAERAAAERWKLSDRELAIVARLDAGKEADA